MKIPKESEKERTVSENPDIAIIENINQKETEAFSIKSYEKSQRILIVEHNTQECELLSELLSNEYVIYTASNGVEGIRLAKKHLPALVIAEVSVSEEDEFEFCKSLKHNFYTSHIPIIILTSLDSDKNKIKGLESGADEIISKPYKPSILNARIRNILESRKYLQKRIINDVKIQPSEFALSDPDEAFLSKTIQIIEDNINSIELDVSKLAEQMNITTISLYRKLKTLTGLSIIQFIRSIRLKRAACLLETKKYTVQDITYMVGFSDTKYFRKCFCKQFGTTPSEYEESKLS